MAAIEVFRTNVSCPRAAAVLLRQLRACFPGWRITFDLDDCDRVLRVQSPDQPPCPVRVAAILRGSGYCCAPLPD